MDTDACIAGIIFSSFQGEVRMETQQVVVRPDSATGARPHFDIDRGERWSTKFSASSKP